MVVVVVVRQMDVRVDDRPAIISRRLFGRAWVEGREGEEDLVPVARVNAFAAPAKF